MIMMLRRPTVVRLGATVAWMCLTVALGAVKGLTQAPAGSDGWHIADGAATEINPLPVTQAVIAKGQSLYRAKCRRCHGVDGRGQGPDADRDHPPGDLTDGRRASRNPDGVMFYKIWNGRAKPRMPAMKTDITRDEVWTVIHYVKTLRQ
jgi:mono/diheme cytochrome c family protein